MDVTLPAGSYVDPAAGSGMVVVCGNAGVRAYTLGRGYLSWSESSTPCTATPTIANGLVYVPEPSGVAIFDLYGTLVTHLGVSGGVGPLAVVDGAVHAGVGLTGVERWSLPSPPPPGAAPGVASLRRDEALGTS